MRSSFAIVLALVAASSFAQKGVGAPSDVPKNHWAYEAVDEMFKLGLLSGYPNGTFNGSRPVSRYELAVAMDSLDRAFDIPSVKASSDLSPLKAQLDEMEKELAQIRRSGDELAALKASMTGLKERMGAIKSGVTKVRAGLDKAKS